jgi:hypothetical protein
MVPILAVIVHLLVCAPSQGGVRPMLLTTSSFSPDMPLAEQSTAAKVATDQLSVADHSEPAMRRIVAAVRRNDFAVVPAVKDWSARHLLQQISLPPPECA